VIRKPCPPTGGWGFYLGLSANNGLGLILVMKTAQQEVVVNKINYSSYEIYFICIDINLLISIF
jgi:hypothetical protein